MAMIKTSEEIEKLREGGAHLSRALQAAMKVCVAGASTVEIDRVARSVIEEAGGRPSFLGYQIDSTDPPYPSTLCISINDEVVHGPATPERIIKDGDIVGLDIGMWYKDLATDMATTVIVGSVPDRVRELVADTRASLVAGMEAVREGKYVHDISMAVENALKPKKYGIVRELVGHGVGHKVHEEPQVPNFYDQRLPPLMLKTGMVLAIEPMVTLGGWRVRVKEDEWTIATMDGSLSAHFEVTIAVTPTGYDLLTAWPDVS